MKDLSYIFLGNWLKVPDALYFILLFGAVIALAISMGVIIYHFVRKKDKVKLRVWLTTALISLVMIALTMTGKIAPYCSFGG